MLCLWPIKWPSAACLTLIPVDPFVKGKSWLQNHCLGDRNYKCCLKDQLCAEVILSSWKCDSRVVTASILEILAVRLFFFLIYWWGILWSCFFLLLLFMSYQLHDVLKITSFSWVLDIHLCCAQKLENWKRNCLGIFAVNKQET